MRACCDIEGAAPAAAAEDNTLAGGPPADMTEPSTGLTFPGESPDGLPILGVGVRSKFGFNVYAVGVYAKVDDAMNAGDILAELLPHNVDKEVVIKMARGVGAEKMTSALDEAMSGSAEAKEAFKKAMMEISPSEITDKHQMRFTSVTAEEGPGLKIEFSSPGGELAEKTVAAEGLSEMFADVFLGVKGTGVSPDLQDSIKATFPRRLAALSGAAEPIDVGGAPAKKGACQGCACSIQ